MSELIVLIIVLLLCFSGLAWYARHKSQKRSKTFERNDISNQNGDTVSDEFSAILQQEITQSDGNVDELDLEPVISLSTDAQALKQDKVKATSLAAANSDKKQALETIRIPTESKQLEPETIQTIQTKQDDWDLMIVLSVLAKQNRSFNGLDIKRVFDELAMTYGAMKTYNKTLPSKPHQVLFNVANMMSPGTLEPNELGTLQTQGLVFFGTLPNAINGLTLLDEMLDTATKTAKLLNGELCDDQHQALTDNYLERIRSKILNFNLTLQMEQNQS